MQCNFHIILCSREISFHFSTLAADASLSSFCVLKVLTALSAIGNTGQPRAVNVLNRCLNYRVPLEVRVAAAQAFRRMPCDADVSRFCLSMCLTADVSGFCESVCLTADESGFCLSVCLIADVSGFCLSVVLWLFRPSAVCPVMLT